MSMQVTFSRPKQFADRIRSYEIELDGVPFINIRASEQKTVEIPEGTKSLQAKIDWCCSKKLPIENLKPNQEIVVKNSYSHLALIPFMPLFAIIILVN